MSIVLNEGGLSKKQLLLANALKRILKPYIKLMLANQLNYTFLTDFLKTIFLEVTEEELNTCDKRLTDSAISLASGLHRKDVRRLRETPASMEAVIPNNIALGAELVAIWTSDARYTDKNDNAKPLPRFAKEGEESFESLVRSVTTDIHPRAVFDEWMRLGVASIDAANMVSLTNDAFVPQAGFEEKAFYFEHNLHDHAQAAVANMLGQQPSYLERCVHYDELSESSIAVINAVAKKQGMKALQEVFKIADASAATDKAKPNANMRMTYGIYFYHEPMNKNINKYEK